MYTWEGTRVKQNMWCCGKLAPTILQWKSANSWLLHGHQQTGSNMAFHELPWAVAHLALHEGQGKDLGGILTHAVMCVLTGHEFRAFVFVQNNMSLVWRTVDWGGACLCSLLTTFMTDMEKQPKTPIFCDWKISPAYPHRAHIHTHTGHTFTALIYTNLHTHTYRAHTHTDSTYWRYTHTLTCEHTHTHTQSLHLTESDSDDISSALISVACA